MLETLVASRIRRQLFEFLLAHPADRFYLRGLAKDLGLSISPLRRELKRLEQSGMLHAFHEGNILFYTVDTASPSYRQLAGAGHPGEAPVAVLADASAVPLTPIPLGIIRHEAQTATVRRIWPMALATAFGLAGMVAVVDVSFKAMTQQHILSAAAPSPAPRAGAPSASGVMRGHRWQVVPGSFGGFSAGGN